MFLILVKSTLSILLLPVLSYPRNYCQIQCCEEFPLRFLLRVFILSSYVVGFYPFWVNFCIWYKVRAQLSFCLFVCLFVCIWISVFPSTIDWKDCLFSIRWSWHPCRNHLTIYERVCFWASCSIPLFYMSVFMSVLHCFDYHGFVVTFDIKKCEISNFVLFQDCLAIRCPLRFHMNFSMHFSIYANNIVGIFTEIALNMQITLDRIDILTILHFSIPKH